MEIKAKRVMKRRSNCSCSMPGVWRAVSYLQGAVVLFHSPRACAHIARRMDVGAYYRNVTDAQGECYIDTVPLLTSDLEEEEAVFGGENRLKRALYYAIETYSPKVVLVANSCVSGVIGDDTAAIGAEIEAETGVPVCVVSAHGFLDGEYFQGYVDTARMLIERFMKPQAKIPDTVMLFGDCGGLYGEYVKTLRRLLGYFGMKITTCFPSFGTVDDLEKAPAASLIIVLGRYVDDARQKKLAVLAKQMGEKFDIPVISDNYPAGYEKTLEWLQYMGEFLNKPEQARLAIAEEKKAYNDVIVSAKKYLRGKKTVYCAGRLQIYFQPGEVIQLLKDLEIKLLGVSLFDCYEDDERKTVLEKLSAAAAEVPIIESGEKDKILSQADFVLTTHELLNTNIKQVYTPFMSSAGWTSERDLTEAMKKVVCRKISRGGLVYA